MVFCKLKQTKKERGLIYNWHFFIKKINFEFTKWSLMNHVPLYRSISNIKIFL